MSTIKLSHLLREFQLSLAAGHLDKMKTADITLEFLSDKVEPSGDYWSDTEDAVKKLFNSPDPNAVVKAIKKADFKKIASSGQYSVWQGMSGRGRYIKFICLDSSAPKDKCIIGYIDVVSGQSKYNQFKLFNPKIAFDLQPYQVSLSEVGVEYRGMGIGKMLYSTVYDYVTDQGGCLMSDNTLFAGSAGMWSRYMPTIASYFGVVLGDIVLPIDADDLKIKPGAKVGFEHFIAMENPPKSIRQLMYNVQGLSFVDGEYGVVYLSNQGINKKLPQINTTFSDLVDSKDNMKSLLTALTQANAVANVGGAVSSALYYGKDSKIPASLMKMKATVFVFYDAIVIVKDLGTGLSLVPIR